MKISTREFKNIVRSIIKEEIEKVEEITGSSDDWKVAQRFSDTPENPSKDIEAPEEESKETLYAKFAKLLSFKTGKKHSKEDVKELLKQS